jgi:hypothetical protein
MKKLQADKDLLLTYTPEELKIIDARVEDLTYNRTHQKH